jgi:signal transduction histidine kinase
MGIQPALCQSVVDLPADYMVIGDKIEILTDTNSSISLNDAIKSSGFVKSDTKFPNFSVTDYSYWLRFKIRRPDASKYFIHIQQPTLDRVDFYQLDNQRIVNQNTSGTVTKYNSRLIQHQSFIYPIKEINNPEYTFYLKVRSGKQLTLPIYIGTIDQVYQRNLLKDILFGVYVGILLSMLLYNLFIYTTVKDRNYIYYVVYLATVLLTQASLEGYLFRFILPNHPGLANASIYIHSALLGLAAIEFSKNFLSTKVFLPRMHKVSYVFWVGYLITIILFFTGHHNASYQLILLSAMLSAVYVLYMAIRIVAMGSRSAKFFLIAWSVFILCVIMYVLKDLDVFPYNTFTNSALLLGSALEALMLSFALADKINIFKQEKERSQEETVKALKENERIVREQNVLLEEKVKERTEALEETNHSLNDALVNLKEAQSQLVDSEKMASLGQLTAGIAHEINNPINFVTSNIKPLELDISDLNEVISKYESLDLNGDLNEQLSQIDAFKRQIDLAYIRDEIGSLLSGIGEGAKRTAEIIRSLKNFSRLDEMDSKPVDLNEGLASTLVLVKNTFPDYLTVVKDFGEMPIVDCLPGKINQVFMNLITNAVQAIVSKGDKNGATLTIRTWQENENVKISIKDTGTGMPEEVKQKIFEPFFTTKDVGEGTGLGLSIVFRIIENHQGNIDVITNVNQGTEFIITLPINRQ